jgi:hypothetical protein
MVNEGLEWSSSFNYKVKGVSGFPKSLGIILRQTIVAIGKAFSKLGVLPSFLPISLHNLLHATGHGFRS